MYVRGAPKPLPQDAPFSKKELDAVTAVFRLPREPVAGEQPELKLPGAAGGGSGSGLGVLSCEPEHAADLLAVSFFLSSCRNQLGIEGELAALPSLERALGSDEHTTSTMIHLHLTLMRFQMPEAPPNAPTRRMAAALKEVWLLSWQETLADFLLWQARDGADGVDAADDPEAAEAALAEAVRQLRTAEYHAIPPPTRLAILKRLCDGALEQDEIRIAVDRRAEWGAGQPWSWEAASALGKVSAAYDLSQLPRVDTLGRDRHGRAYHLHEGALWVASEGAGCACIEGAPRVKRLVATLAKGRAPCEVRLHFTLSRLLADGAIATAASSAEAPTAAVTRRAAGRGRGGGRGAAGAAAASGDGDGDDDDDDDGDDGDDGDGSSGPTEMQLPAPNYEGSRVTTGAVRTALNPGRWHARVFILDLVKHVCRTVDRCAGTDRECVFSLPSVTRYLLQHLEFFLPKQLFEPEWEGEKGAWRARVQGAADAASLGEALLQLERALKREAFNAQWTQKPFAELLPPPRPSSALSAGGSKAAGGSAAKGGGRRAAEGAQAARGRRGGGGGGGGGGSGRRGRGGEAMDVESTGRRRRGRRRGGRRGRGRGGGGGGGGGRWRGERGGREEGWPRVRRGGALRPMLPLRVGLGRRPSDALRRV